MGSKSLWEPRAELGTEGSPNQNLRKPIAEQSREKESEIYSPPNIPTQDVG
jgi:hypothetical protein